MKTRWNKQAKRARCDHDADYAVITSFTAHPAMLTRAQDELVDRVREGGFKCNRSRVIQALLTLAMDASHLIDAQEVTDGESLTRELQRVICIKANVTRKRRI